jgi:hypothetical protein
LVELKAMVSQNISWPMRLDGASIANTNIRQISIDQFYKLVTGNSQAFKQLKKVIPHVIEDVIQDIQSGTTSNSPGSELQKVDPNSLKDLYILSFKRFEGFEDVNVW